MHIRLSDLTYHSHSDVRRDADFCKSALQDQINEAQARRLGRNSRASNTKHLESCAYCKCYTSMLPNVTSWRTLVLMKTAAWPDLGLQRVEKGCTYNDKHNDDFEKLCKHKKKKKKSEYPSPHEVHSPG